MRGLVESVRRLLGFNATRGSVEAWVERAAYELIHRNNQDEIEAALVRAGAAPSFASKLVLLIPSAFARERFSGDGIEFPDTFLVGSAGNFKERQYSAEPVYLTARSLARHWLAEGKSSLIARIVDWSAEGSVIRQARERGLTPTRMSAVHHGF